MIIHQPWLVQSVSWWACCGVVVQVTICACCADVCYHSLPSLACLGTTHAGPLLLSPWHHTVMCLRPLLAWLQEIAEHKGIPSFWVDSAARIDVEGNKVSSSRRSDPVPALPSTSGVDAFASPESMQADSADGPLHCKSLVNRTIHGMHSSSSHRSCTVYSSRQSRVHSRHLAVPHITLATSRTTHTYLWSCRCCTRLGGVS